MSKFNRILAIVVMVISIIVLLVSLAGIVGTWIIRPQVISSLETLAGGAESRVATGLDGLDGLDQRLGNAYDQVKAVEDDLKEFGNDVEENRPLATAISDRLESRLGPLVDGTQEVVTTISGVIESVNSTIETINSIPFVSVPTPDLNRIAKLSEDLDNLRNQVQDLRKEMDQRRSEIIGGSLSIITKPTSEIITTIEGVQTRISGIQGRLSAVQEGLIKFKLGARGWLTWIAVIATVIMAWIAFSQVGLLVITWRFYSGQDLLAQTAGNLKVEQEVIDTPKDEESSG